MSTINRAVFVKTSERKCEEWALSLRGALCLYGRGLKQGRAGQGKVRFYYLSQHRHSAADCFPVGALCGRCCRTTGTVQKMTSMDPLKSVISFVNADDTSLALPSVNQYRSGRQRVLEQVQTVRRTKSRQSSSRSGSTSLSPTSKSSQYTRAADTTQDFGVLATWREFYN